MKRLLLLPVLLLAGATFLTTTAFAPEDAPPKKVWICHIDGHSGIVTDYVLLWVPDMPRANQIRNCDVREGNLLYVSENGARRGHNARAQERIDGYPD